MRVKHKSTDLVWACGCGWWYTGEMYLDIYVGRRPTEDECHEWDCEETTWRNVWRMLASNEGIEPYWIVVHDE